MDPKNPGAVDEIIHLGDYWDVEKMEENKEKILKTNAEVGKLFKRAYKYLRAARPILEDIIEKNSEAMDFGKVNLETENLANEIFKDKPVSKKEGKDRHLFGSAYTPNGWIEHTDTLLSDLNKIYYIKGDFGAGKTTLLEKIYMDAIKRGLNVEVYHTPLIPEKIETVVIEEIGVGLTISKMFKDNNYKTVNLDKYIDKKVLEKYENDINEDKEIFEELINLAISNLSRAKKTHDLLEEYFIPNMNFGEIEKLKDRIIKRILKYEK
ncbi:ATP-binding protein [Thermohalobacter berrensis]|uniref:ATP-binding protein n=1 Tax=Thermohalobacter berrensis TaxID=99594 RepID=A0A419T4I6_9FIRM|nr:ATP-binding protein [Thermohalobacter berrensis]RKD32450.1 ATP-binding protein [Thermohalobacter berrensis]